MDGRDVMRCRELQRSAWCGALGASIHRCCPACPAMRLLFSPAEKNGWEYEVEDFHTPSKARPKRYQGYGDK